MSLCDSVRSKGLAPLTLKTMSDTHVFTNVFAVVQSLRYLLQLHTPTEKGPQFRQAQYFAMASLAFVV